jgi:hypothetical protein
MRMSALLILSVFAATALPAAGGDTKLKKPSLTLRSSPRFAFSPARVLFVAELSGGDDVEEYYCPELEWEWDDGSKSVQESDCDPFVAGQTKIERRFTSEHEFRRAANYNIKVSLKRLGKTFANQSVRLTVRAGVGDPTFESDN